MSKLKVGDTVSVRGGFGTEAPRKVVVDSIEVCEIGSREGEDVGEIEWSKANSREVIISYEDSWAYGTQIKRVN